MGDENRPESGTSRDSYSGKCSLSWWGIISHGIAKWVLGRIPDSARAAAVYDTKEYQKAMQIADELYQGTLDFQDDTIALQEASEQAERRANLLEDRLKDSADMLAHAEKMKLEAEARSKKAYKEKDELGQRVILLKQDLNEATSALEAQAAYFDEKLTQRVNEVEEAGRRKANDLSTLVKHLSSAVSRLEAMEIVYHDSLDLVPGKVLCLDAKNGVAKASAGFKKAFGIPDSYFEVPLPEDVQARARPAGSRQSVKSKPLAEVLANPEILARYNEYAEYFFPQLWDEPHFSMVLDLDVNGRRRQYMANVKILKKAVVVRDGIRQEVRFAYAGARVELDKVPSRLLRDLKETVSLFFRSRIAYSTPEGAVKSYDIDRAVKDALSSSVNGEKEKKVLIDFTNAGPVDSEAVKKTVEFYQFFRRQGVSERYFIVPQRLRDDFFNAGLPPRAMLLPENYKKREEKPLTAPGLSPQQA